MSTSQQPLTRTALPHIPHGMAIPEIHIKKNNEHEFLMPGKKNLDSSADGTEIGQQQLVPAADPGTRRRLSVARQGLPWTERQNKIQVDDETEPPPMFTAAPKKMNIRHSRESKSQKQMYRMENGINPVNVLCGRLEAWRLAIKDMVSMFKKVMAVESKTSKGLIASSKEIVLPFEKSNGQFLETGSGGIQDVWASIRDYTMDNGVKHHQTAEYIEKAIIPALRAIKTDIRTMIQSIHTDKRLKNTFIFESRSHVDRLIGKLDKVIESVNRNPLTPDQDPFLVNLAIIHAVRQLCDDENDLHDNILNLQHETALFEEKIIENMRYVVQKYQEFRVKHEIEPSHVIGRVVDTLNELKPNMEWNEFVRRNQYNLIFENSAYKTEEMVEYAHQDSKYCRATKIGPLQMKNQMKGWIEGVYILTPAGFLHGYKTPEHFQGNPLKPSFSIFVPHYSVEENRDGSFELRQAEKRTPMASHYVFACDDERDGQEWIDAFYRINDQFRVVPLLEPSYPANNAVPRRQDLPILPDTVLPIEDAPANEHRSIEDKPLPKPLPQLEQETPLDPNTYDQSSYAATTPRYEQRHSMDDPTTPDSPRTPMISNTAFMANQHQSGQSMGDQASPMSSSGHQEDNHTAALDGHPAAAVYTTTHHDIESRDENYQGGAAMSRTDMDYSNPQQDERRQVSSSGQDDYEPLCRPEVANQDQQHDGPDNKPSPIDTSRLDQRSQNNGGFDNDERNQRHLMDHHGQQDGESYGNDYGQQGNNYGQQGNNYDQQDNNYGQQGNNYDQQGNNYDQQGNNYDQQDNNYGQQNTSGNRQGSYGGGSRQDSSTTGMSSSQMTDEYDGTTAVTDNDLQFSPIPRTEPEFHHQKAPMSVLLNNQHQYDQTSGNDEEEDIRRASFHSKTADHGDDHGYSMGHSQESMGHEDNAPVVNQH